MEVINMFEKVLENPRLYLGTKSISRLNAYMNGYIYAVQSIRPEFNTQTLWNFYHWLDRQYQIKTTHSWAEVILFMSFNDETKAFDTVKQYWEEYKSEVKRLNSFENQKLE